MRKYHFLPMKAILIFFITFIISTVSFSQEDHSKHNMPGMNQKKEEETAPKQKPVKKQSPKKPTKQKPVQQPDKMPTDHDKMDMNQKQNTMPINKGNKVPMDQGKDKEVESSLNKPFEPTGKVVTYHLYIKDTIVNYTGKNAKAIAINGKIPGPTLYFTEGDTAEIWVHNFMHMETSVHWHGVLVPNLFDGVPYLTTPPIEHGKYFIYRFAVKQTGTYWYHSHTMLQEQSGQYGSIVIQPKEKKYKVKDEIVLVLSDWTNQKPEKVLKNLKRRNEYYTIKKGYAQSLDKLIKHKAVWDRLYGSAQRMPAMDISDVYYHRFLTNGYPEIDLSQYKPGDKIRIRIIDAGASTNFNLQFAGGQMQMIAADGLDIEPIMVDQVLINVAETYDFLITIPSEGSFEFRATAQDISGHSSTFFGEGNKIFAPDLPKLNVWKMMGGMGGMNMGNMNMNDMNSKGTDMGDMEMNKKEKQPPKNQNEMNHENMKMDGEHNMQQDTSMKKEMNMNNMNMSRDTSVQKEMNMDMDKSNNGNMAAPHGNIVFSYDMLRSPVKTVFPSDMPLREITLTLTGNMYRYVWSINDKVLSDADKILIEKGEIVRIHLENSTMMNHPMHLHGHFFRVLNKNGEYSPLKHTVNVPPFSKVILEFEANEEKEWFFHCHILYHMMSGMSRIFSYKYSVRDPLLQPYPLKRLVNEDRKWYFWSDLSVKSQMNELRAVYSNTKNALRMENDANYTGQYEIEASYERYLTDYFRPYIGIALLNQKYFNILTNEQTFAQQYNLPVAGIHYTLPFFIESDLRINAKGRVRLQLDWQLWILPRVFTLYRVNTDKEYHIDAQYVLSRDFALSAGYDSRYKWGGGLLWRF